MGPAWAAATLAPGRPSSSNFAIPAANSAAVSAIQTVQPMPVTQPRPARTKSATSSAPHRHRLQHFFIGSRRLERRDHHQICFVYRGCFRTSSTSAELKNLKIEARLQYPGSLMNPMRSRHPVPRHHSAQLAKSTSGKGESPRSNIETPRCSGNAETVRINSTFRPICFASAERCHARSTPFSITFPAPRQHAILLRTD